MTEGMRNLYICILGCEWKVYDYRYGNYNFIVIAAPPNTRNPEDFYFCRFFIPYQGVKDE